MAETKKNQTKKAGAKGGTASSGSKKQPRNADGQFKAKPKSK